MPLLELRGVTKAFGTLMAIDRVSLDVEEGTLHAIIGPNGAGKTTLFNLISGEHGPTAGSIRFRGRAIERRPPHHVARLGIGRSFQRTNIFPGLTVFENVRLGVQPHLSGNFNFLTRRGNLARASERAWDVLEQVGLTALKNAKAAELSHGDQRILEMAITLAASPALLLLDEPTCGMSREETARMVRLIHAISQRHTVLLIEHNMHLVMTVSDRITVLHFGEVLADGTPAEVRQHADVRRAYLGSLP